MFGMKLIMNIFLFNVNDDALGYRLGIMVKSYFEKEITAYLMFIISGPQKVFLFLKHIRNTNSSYRSQLLRFHFQIQSE